MGGQYGRIGLKAPNTEASYHERELLTNCNDPEAYRQDAIDARDYVDHILDDAPGSLPG
jgi:hypothetical protein